MNSINSPVNTTTTITSHLESISNTCNALISALECTTESTSQYGGGIVHQFDSEYVDIIIRTLVKLRVYTLRLKKEINNGLIKNNQDLQLMTEGMQNLTDQLDQLMMQNGFLKNNFEFGIQEIKNNIQAILEKTPINP